MDTDVIIQTAVTNQIAQEVSDTAKRSGFHEDWELSYQLEDLAGLGDDPHEGVVLTQDEIATLRKAAQALRNNVIGMKLMLIVSECAEALETLRDHGAEGVMAGEGNFGEELADVQIRLGDLAVMTHQNLGREIAEKMVKNASRPHKHGRTL